MNTKRLMLIICLVTFLGLITAWQQVQTTRWGYRIFEATELKKQLLEEEKELKIQLTHIKSPGQLLALAEDKRITLYYLENLNVVNVLKQINKKPPLAQVDYRDDSIQYSINKE